MILAGLQVHSCVCFGFDSTADQLTYFYQHKNITINYTIINDLHYTIINDLHLDHLTIKLHYFKLVLVSYFG
jgi:hypothetical protein